jgi:hypothetical protein
LASLANELAMALGAELDAYLPWMERIVSVARRRYNGEKVPNKEKVFSLFEPHTELIQKGKRSKPMEFGERAVPSQYASHSVDSRHVVPLTDISDQRERVVATVR